MKKTKTKFEIVKKMYADSKEGKAALKKIMESLDASIINVKEHLFQVIENLFTIDKEELFYYDKCKNMSEFIKKHKYPEKMQIKQATIQMRLRTFRYATDIGLTNEKYKEIGYSKLEIIKNANIKNVDKIDELGQMSAKAIKDRLFRKTHPIKGDFIPKKQDETNIEQRENTTAKRIWFEIPIDFTKIFEERLIELCLKYDVKIL